MNRELVQTAVDDTDEDKIGIGLVICAVVTLAAVGFIIRVFGFPGVRAFLGRVPAVNSVTADMTRTIMARVRGAVGRAVGFRLTPAMCLRRAAAAATLLRLMGVRASVVIGVQRLPFAAHAWAEVDGEVVAEHAGWVHDYQVIDRF
jgi:hypothetical protein